MPFCLQQVAPRARLSIRRVRPRSFYMGRAVMTLPPGITASDFSDALEQFRRAVGRSTSIPTSNSSATSTRTRSRTTTLMPPPPSCAREHRGSAGDPQDRQPVRRATVADLLRQESWLRRCRAAHARHRRARSQSDEPDSRGERRVRLRAAGAGCQLLRSLSVHPGRATNSGWMYPIPDGAVSSAMRWSAASVTRHMAITS